MTVPGGLLLFVAAFGAGAVNAVAGGGTLLTFPILLALGLPPVVANATSTVGLVPGSLAGAWGYRRELDEVRGWLKWLVAPSIVGGGLGALLLLVTPPVTFDRLVPWLVLAATGLFALAGRVARLAGARVGGASASTARTLVVAGLQLLVAVYGGYFGAGLGIMMLASLSLLSLGSLHAANGLKTLCGAAINAVASALFVARGLVDVPSASVVVGGSIIGGLAGAGLARRLGTGRLRGLVIAAGLLAAAFLFLR